MEHDPEIMKICAEAYLNYVKSISAKIKNEQGQIEEKRALLELTGVSYGEAVSGSGAIDTMERGVIELHSLIKEFCTDLIEYVEQQRIARIVFMRLSRPEYTTAFMRRYLQCKSWEQVCVEMGYSYDGMMKLRRRAITEVYDLMPKEWQKDAIPNAL